MLLSSEVKYFRISNSYLCPSLVQIQLKGNNKSKS